MINAYIEARKHGGRYTGQIVSERTLHDYHKILTSVEKFRETALENWAYKDAQEYIQMRTRQGMSANTINLELVVCRGFFDWYCKEHAKKDNPFEGIARRPRNSKFPTILSRDEVQKLFPKNPTYSLLFKIMYYGGLRIGEARMLRKDSVQERGLLITGKGQKERFIPIHPNLLKEIHEYIKEDTSDSLYVFHRNEEPLGERNIQRRFKTAAKRAGLPDKITPHNLRHTCASHMYAGSLDVVATKDLLGHQNIATTMIYVNLHRDDVENAYQKAFDY